MITIESPRIGNGESSKFEAARSGAGYHTFKFDSYQEFSKAVDVVAQNRDPKDQHEYVWRGAADPDWQLLSNLSRVLQKKQRGIRDIKSDWIAKQIRSFLMAIRGIYDFSDVYRSVLNRLDRAARESNLAIVAILADLVPDERQALFDLFALGQHFKLNTPLLDWTLSPYVALYFAFEESGSREDGIGYRVVYAINRTLVERECPPNNPVRSEDLRFVESLAHHNGRILGQSGLFTLLLSHQAIEEWVTARFARHDKVPVLLRFMIRNDKRHDCLEWLWSMNIHARSLFPDYDGASRDCNYRLENDLDKSSHGDHQ